MLLPVVLEFETIIEVVVDVPVVANIDASVAIILIAVIVGSILIFHTEPGTIPTPLVLGTSKFILASAADVALVPPLAIGNNVSRMRCPVINGSFEM
jgi:hypothetical protein